MKINFKEYSSETADELHKVFASKKEVKGAGTFEVVATNETTDRDGEIVTASGLDIKNYMMNPVILWAHNYYSWPIGAATKVSLNNNNEWIVSGVFADTEEGQKARKLYDDGILKAVSIGFIPKNREGNVISESELLELSFVPVPSNPTALSMRAVKGFENLIKKNVMKEMKMALINGDEEAYNIVCLKYVQIGLDAPVFKTYTQYEIDQLFGTKTMKMNMSDVSAAVEDLKSDINTALDD